MRGCTVQRWSLSLGRWAGVHVRVHIFLLLFAALSLAFIREPDLYWASILTLAITLGSLALHEAAHALAAWRVGGKVDSIILGPVGGLVTPRVPDEPEVQLFVALAGPIVHLSLVVVAAVGLALAGNADILSLLHPLNLNLWTGTDPNWLLVGKLTLWINWMLMLLNLLPAYPFDGGPIFRAMLWPALGRRTARIVTGRAGMVIGVLIAAAAFLPMSAPEHSSWIQVRLPLVMLGIFVFFSARQDLVSDWSEDLFDDVTGYRVRSDGLDLLEPIELDEEEEVVLVEHQRRQGEPPQEQRRQAQEAYEDARVDDILARLHDTSMNELSREDLEILQRASQRYKHRLNIDDSE